MVKCRARAVVAFVAVALLAGGAAHAHPSVDAQLATLAQRSAGDPCDARVELHRGELLRTRGELDAAKAAFDAAAACDPTLADADLARAELFLESGLAAQAVPLLDLHAADPRALLLRGRARVALSRFADAAADYDAALRQLPAPQPEHYLDRADAQIRAGQLEAAARGLDQGLDRLGPVPALLRRAVDVEIRGGNVEAALRHLDRARSLPGQEVWLLRRGEVLEAAGRPCEARAAFEAAIQAIATRPAARRETPALKALMDRAQAASARLAACEAGRHDRSDRSDRSHGSHGTYSSYFTPGGTP